MTNHDTASPLDAPAETTSGTAVANTFLAALGARDFHQLETCFHPETRFRALVPQGLREGTGPKETVGWLSNWFSTADSFELIKSEVDQLADRLRIAYRIRIQDRAGWHVVEQQAYCTVKDDRVEAMDLLCSGFRPAPNSAETKAGNVVE